MTRLPVVVLRTPPLEDPTLIREARRAWAEEALDAIRRVQAYGELPPKRPVP